ncbi:MAG TPA: ATP-binding cassette domain-containing protein [Syntrophobacteria bacterium]|nr:ATP-binding cassette domain-containing protein [Syntrophobacteria bacterium]
MLYEIINLKKIYGGRTVLDLPALSLEPGRVIALLGPNGAGKTTLLEVLAFLSPPSSGEVRFMGRRVDFRANGLIQHRRRVVLVQQHPIMFSTTVCRNVEFPLRVRNIPKAEREKVVEELLRLVGMTEFKEAKGHTLSGGETQRVAIARALACSPEVILFDEPTASVDVENQIAIERIIGEIRGRKGISVVFTTHNMVQASRLAEQTLFLFEGKLARSTYENIFTGRIELGADGDGYCSVQSSLRVKVKAETTGPVRVAFDAGSLRISRTRNESPRGDSLQGRLVQLADEGARVRALVDVGIPLTVLLPTQEFKALSPTVGEVFWVTVPPEAIELI